MAKPRKPGAPPLTQGQTVWLAASACGVLVPLAPYLPLWLDALCAVAILWRGWLLWRRVPLPPRWLVNLMAVVGAIGVAIHFRTLLGKDPGVALLTLFLALKLFETRSARDAFAVVLLGFFLILSQFFYTQSMVTAVAMVATTLLVTTTLAVLQRSSTPPLQAVRLAGSMLLQALPFMLLLFLFFPRVSGPLWGLPADAYSGLSGLSDTMSPGSISRLSLSDAIAFRARFTEPPPDQVQLYWRGPVLTRYDGRSWRLGLSGLASEAAAQMAQPVDYEITLEPHNQPWLFALDHPSRLPPNAVLTKNFQVVAKRPVRSRLRYAMQSVLDAHVGRNESADALGEALQLPADFNPRARALAASLRAVSRNDAEVVARMLARFRKETFVYTLSPPLLGRDSVDEFLFDTRRGFCEHYASAFVFVMRAAGIPARVVTGYQGGEVNPVDGYLLVRQLDAHAWTEIWLPQRGWQRVDPTAEIAPNRVEQNLAAAIPQSDALPLMTRPELNWLRQLRYRWEAASNAWNQWVLGYDEQRQYALLRLLGIPSPDWSALGALTATAGGVLMLALTAWTLHQRRRADPLHALWQRFERKLAKRGLGRAMWEGPADYAARLVRALPRREAEIASICTIYQAARYGKLIESAVTRRQQLSELKRRIAAFTS
jgi:transglutaminase-like putative cysteine protease